MSTKHRKLASIEKGLNEKGLLTREYIDQLKYELRIIKEKNFSEYFMHVVI